MSNWIKIKIDDTSSYQSLVNHYKHAVTKCNFINQYFTLTEMTSITKDDNIYNIKTLQAFLESNNLIDKFRPINYPKCVLMLINVSKFDKEKSNMIEQFYNSIPEINKEIITETNSSQLHSNLHLTMPEDFQQSLKCLVCPKEATKQSMHYSYTKEEMIEYIHFSNKFKNISNEHIRFDEMIENTDEVFLDSTYNNSWSCDQVVNANKNAYKMCDFVKNNNLSPYEAMIYLHKEITRTYRYKNSESLLGRNEKKISVQESQTIMGTQGPDKYFVCAGYASLLKSTIDLIDMPGLKCEIANCKILNKKYSAICGHAHNFITIKDDKYNIIGTYAQDCTWDAHKHDEQILDSSNLNGKGFAHCLYPLSDVHNLIKYKYIPQTAKSKFESVMYDRDAFIKNIDKLTEELQLIKNLDSNNTLPNKVNYLATKFNRYIEEKKGNNKQRQSDMQTEKASIENLSKVQATKIDRQSLVNALQVLNNIDEFESVNIFEELENSKKHASAGFNKEANNIFLTNEITLDKK